MGKKKPRDIIVSVFESDLLMRQILLSMLRREDGIRLAGSSGFKGIESGISKLKSIRPDVVMLSVDETESEEMSFFYRIRKEFPDMYVILLTPLNKEGAAAAIEGLKNGALDFVTKPERRKSLVLAENHFHKRVLPVINAMPRFNQKRSYGKPAVENSLPVGKGKNSPVFSGKTGQSRFQLIVIGSCLGGLSSLYKVISGLPKNLSIPIVVIQHMPKIYTSALSADLDSVTPLRVREAKNDNLLQPGQIYIAPGGYHLVIKNEGNQKKMYLHRGPREHRCRPSIDVMLRSAIQAFNGNILTVFLSGGGGDGVTGAMEVLNQGGRILLESEESALLWDTASHILDMDSDSKIPVADADSLAKELMTLLYENTGIGFTGGITKPVPEAKNYFTGLF
jgi:two-component system chemotaxis response regulator CheB